MGMKIHRKKKRCGDRRKQRNRQKEEIGLQSQQSSAGMKRIYAHTKDGLYRQTIDALKKNLDPQTDERLTMWHIRKETAQFKMRDDSDTKREKQRLCRLRRRRRTMRDRERQTRAGYGGWIIQRESLACM
jgi:hypothetical protein